MPTDATYLWWPPLKRLYKLLVQAPFSTSASAASALEGRLAEYEEVLLRGPAFFKAPQAQSRKKLETETALAIGSKKLPVDAALRGPALELSLLLSVDELQAYILLRRWLSDEGEVIVDSGLSAQQRQSLQAYYFSERNYILRCLDGLLQFGSDEAADGTAGKVMVRVSKKLLEKGLEDNICDALLANLNPPVTANSTALVVSGGEQQLAASYAAISVDNQGNSARVVQDQLERGALLDMAILFFGHCHRSCSLERGMSLLRALRGLLTSGPGVAGQATEGPDRQSLDHLAFILMVAVLDLRKLMQLLSSGKTLDSAAHRLGARASRVDVDEELAEWGLPKAGHMGESTMHGPLLLLWATFLCLSNAASQEEEITWEDHAQQAWTSGALQALAGILPQQGHAPDTQIGMVYRRQLQAFVMAFLGSFSLSPAGLPEPTLDALLTTLGNIYQGQQQLCEQFWEQEEPSNVPLHRFLDDARSLYPAVAAPLLRLLATLASGPSAAEAASAFLDSMPGLACLHLQGDERLQSLPNSSGRVRAAQQLTVQDLSFVIQQGNEGVVVPLPQCLKKGGAGGSEAVEIHVLVRWKVHLPTGRYLLLSQLRSQLTTLQKAAADQRRLAPKAIIDATTSDVGMAVHLLARLAASQPSVILQSAQLEIPPPPEQTGGGDMFLPGLLSQALTTLSKLPVPPLDTLGEVLEVAAALALSMPAKVMADISGALLLQEPQWQTSAILKLPLDGGHAPLDLSETRLPFLQRLSTVAEAQAGRYPVTLATLRLTAILLEAGISHATLQALVGFAVAHVLAKHHRWRYSQRADRWLLASAALRVLRLGISYRSAASPAIPLASSLTRALSQPGAASTYLFGALPPVASALEAMDAVSTAGTVVPIEGTVHEWLELLPPLLAGNGLKTEHLAQAYFTAPDSKSAAPATVIASYIGYPFLDADDRALALESLSALGEAAALLPSVCFAACLPAGPGGSVSTAVRQQLLEPFRHPEQATTEVFRAACRVLLTATLHHPSLQDLLLFPTGLTSTEDAGGGKGGDQRATIVDAKQALVQAKPGAAKAEQPPAWSVLDGLWQVLQAAQRHTGQPPAILACTLHTLLALWQAGPMAFRPVQLLRSQVGFWEAVAACVPDTLQRQLELEDEADPATAWAARSETAWRYAGENGALQLIALEAFLNPRPAPGSEAAKGVWAVIDCWEAEEGGGRLVGLLRRYSGACMGGRLLKQLQQEAEVAALEIVAALLCVEGVGPMLATPESLLAVLNARTQAARSHYNSPEVASSQLLALANNLAKGEMPRPGTHQEHVLTLLRREVAETRSSIPQLLAYGESYLYNAESLQNQVGSLFAQHMASMHSLDATLRATSIMAGAEDARLEALRSLRAAYTISAPEPKQHAKLSAKGQETLDALAACIRPVMDSANAPQPSTSDSFSANRASLAFAAEVAQVALINLRRAELAQQRARSHDASAATALSNQFLKVTLSWLRCLQSMEAWQAQPEHVEEITSCLLASSLITLQLTTPHGPSPQRAKGSEQLQGTLTQLIVPLCGLAGQQGPHSAASLALLTAAMRTHLEPADWLPILQANLDLDGLLQSSFEQLAAAPHAAPSGEGGSDKGRQRMEAVASGALQLVTIVAQDEGGVQLLGEPRLFPSLHAIAQWLLSPDGGGLGEEAVHGAPAAVLGKQQQWISLVALQGLLLRGLAGQQPAELAAVAFAVTAHPRLVAALESPPGEPSSTVSLLGLQEAERALFFLCGLVRLAGRWQLALLHAPTAMRQACSELLAFAALPSSEDAFTVSSPPQTAAEQALAEQPAELAITEGWFNVFGAGSQAPSAGTRHGSRAHAARDSLRTSEYSVQLGEAMYCAMGQALAFLCAMAPEVAQEEAGTLGPEWPTADTLLSLQRQMFALSYDACQRSLAGQPRAQRLCRTLSCLIHSSSHLQEVLCHSQDAAHEAQLKETKTRLSRSLAAARKAG